MNVACVQLPVSRALSVFVCVTLHLALTTCMQAAIQMFIGIVNLKPQEIAVLTYMNDWGGSNLI